MLAHGWRPFPFKKKRAVAVRPVSEWSLLDLFQARVGYAASSEPTLKAFYERLTPFAEPFMALFGRSQLPHRSTLSRFLLAAPDQPTAEALRALFQKDLLARKPFPSPGGLFDRMGAQWLVVDVDGTRQAARQRALPRTDVLPAPHRRFDQVCAPGYTGCKRGEVVRTRTLVLQAHTHQLLGTFGGPGNGDSGDLCVGVWQFGEEGFEGVKKTGI